MERNVTTLAKYLLTKGIDSPTKIQKMLFFFRVEELKQNPNPKNSFFSKDKNFQAWIYGPVNVPSYLVIQEWHNKDIEKEALLLSDKEMNEIDKQYGAYFEKYAGESKEWLIDESHKNVAWINARGSLGSDEICKEYLIEDENFIKFRDGN
ncbi:hypothetical protein [Mycoplasmoides pirum]|uniref:hypothetical protein n=1 Tax=Mycoplasmoides pirum TaxID=2122 RepID=UPI0004890AF1|nr:hypothetical protein [Mycoplasmoides pirum]